MEQKLTFQDLVTKYKSKQQSTLVDSIAAGLSLADEVSIDLGVLGDSGLLTDALEVVSFGVPLALIAVTEGGRVLMGRKTKTAGLQDAAYRVVKTGAAMGAGAVAAGFGLGALPAIPVAMGARMALEKYRNTALTGRRVAQRTQRLRALREQKQQSVVAWQALPEAEAEVS